MAKRILTKDIISFCKEMIKRIQREISKLPGRDSDAEKLILRNRIKYFEQIVSDYEMYKETGKPLAMHPIEFERYSELPLFCAVTGDMVSSQA